MHAWLQTKCAQMYHNIFPVAKRVWETITCSWISVLPRCVSAFHMSHPNIWRMSSLAQGWKLESSFSLWIFFHASSWSVVFFLTTHTRPTLSTHLCMFWLTCYRIHTFKKKQADLIQGYSAAAHMFAGVRGRERKGCCEGILGQTAGRWDSISGLYSWALFGLSEGEEN